MFGATAATLAAYGAYAMRPVRIPEDLAITAFAADLQTPNRAAKTNRLAMLHPERTGAADVAAAGPAVDAMALAEIEPASVEPAEPESNIAAERAPVDVTKIASITPPPLPRERPKHLLPARAAAPAPAPGMFDESQIAGLRGRLRLTSEQAEYWPPVEAALRDVARIQLHGAHRKVAQGGQVAIDVNSPEVQKLIWAAMPLLARLREDQKREVRKIARVIGLEQIASQI